ncbi:MAG: glycosyltransferase family 39 protein [Candidatus Aminicenantes bacterium]|nr:glycosyltransferase family 39 protein [Candidatus Aminicenantes bacterium]
MKPLPAHFKSGSIPRMIWIILAVGILLRVLFPLADPPRDLTISGAPVGDPGQHSYGARNRVVFGQWSFDDWQPHLGSPLISTALNLATYRILGVDFASHKIIPITFSILSLLAFFLLVHQRLPSPAVSAATLFAALSYPLLMYSRTANRYMPMIFFFILAVHFFILGTESKKLRHFLWSAICFLCAYASQNHILYMAGFFAVLGGFWWMRRNLNWKALAVFWGVTLSGLTTWYLLIFMPNRDFFSHFVAHNQLVRRIHSLPRLLLNVLQNPFASQFRNDALLLLLAALGVGLTAALWLRRRRVPLLIEAGVFWLLLSAGFHAIWSYRPTRFYLLPIFAAAILGAWLLQSLVDRSRVHAKTREWMGAFAATASALAVVGFFRFSHILLRLIRTRLPVVLIVFLIAACLLGAAFCRKPIRRLAAVALLAIAAYVNLVHFAQWASQREYRIVRTAEVLSKALPPTTIAGNWASLLSIGGPHRTHLLSGEMGINWRPDFLENQGVQYLLLTRGPFADEYREYMRLFSKQLEQARLAACFPIYSARVQLWELYPRTEKETILEMEAHTLRPAHVVFDPLASGKMALELPPRKEFQVSLSPDLTGKLNGSLALRARGKFRIHVVLREQGTALRRNLVVWNSRKYVSRPVMAGPIPANTSLDLRFSADNRAPRLDKLFQTVSN